MVEPLCGTLGFIYIFVDTFLMGNLMNFFAFRGAKPLSCNQQQQPPKRFDKIPWERRQKMDRTKERKW